jgi:hypothetical protein
VVIFDSAIGIDQIFHYINTTGVIGILVLIILGGQRKWWVFGWQYKDQNERLEKVEQSNIMWMQLALRGANVTEQIVKTVATQDEK